MKQVIKEGGKMMFADLTDTQFKFSCVIDISDYWDYDFVATANEENYFRSLTQNEIKILRDNCKRILESTEYFIGRA
jgi:hypothetical protein